jgi:DNA-binding HxlR family transcriptional regulator
MEQIQHDAFHAACPAREVYNRISDKWVGLVLVGLADGPQHYSDLQRTIVGVSQKMLTQTLRSLERDGLVVRAVSTQRPVRVSYSLTPLGADLLPIMRTLKHWAEHHIGRVHAARAEYDKSAP